MSNSTLCNVSWSMYTSISKVKESREDGREEMWRMAQLAWNWGGTKRPLLRSPFLILVTLASPQPGLLSTPLLCLYLSCNLVQPIHLLPPHWSVPSAPHLSAQLKTYPLQQAFPLFAAMHTALSLLTLLYIVLTYLYQLPSSLYRFFWIDFSVSLVVNLTVGTPTMACGIHN